MGRKGAVLVGRVLDKASQEAVHQAKITIRDAKRPEAYVELFTDKRGLFRFTAPSKPLIVFVTSDQYRAIYLDNSGEWTPSSGERRTVTFELEAR